MRVSVRVRVRVRVRLRVRAHVRVRVRVRVRVPTTRLAELRDDALIVQHAGALHAAEGLR